MSEGRTVRLHVPAERTQPTLILRSLNTIAETLPATLCLLRTVLEVTLIAHFTGSCIRCYESNLKVTRNVEQPLCTKHVAF
jgi:hypothetical protein